MLDNFDPRILDECDVFIICSCHILLDFDPRVYVGHDLSFYIMTVSIVLFRSAQTAFRRMRQLKSLSREAYRSFASAITSICR